MPFLPQTDGMEFKHAMECR